MTWRTFTVSRGSGDRRGGPEQREKAVPESIGCELFVQTRVSQPTHAHSKVVVAQQRDERVHELAGTSLIHEQARLTVNNDVTGGIVNRADARQVSVHRFEIDEAESLTATRHGEDRRIAVERVQFLVGDKSGETDGRAKTGCPSLLFQPRCIVTVSSDDQRRVGYGRDDFGPRLDQLVVSLVTFGSRQPADDEDRVFTDRERTSPGCR